MYVKKFRSPVTGTFVSVAKEVPSVICGVLFVVGGTSVGLIFTGVVAAAIMFLPQLPYLIFKPYVD